MIASGAQTHDLRHFMPDYQESRLARRGYDKYPGCSTLTSRGSHSGDRNSDVTMLISISISGHPRALYQLGIRRVPRQLLKPARPAPRDSPQQHVYPVIDLS